MLAAVGISILKDKYTLGGLKEEEEQELSMKVGCKAFGGGFTPPEGLWPLFCTLKRKIILYY